LHKNTASPLPGSAVLNPGRKSAEAEIRICFREAKHAAIAHSAGPGSDQPKKTSF